MLHFSDSLDVQDKTLGKREGAKKGQNQQTDEDSRSLPVFKGVREGGICSQSDKFALIKGTKQKKKEVGRNVAHLEAVKQV